MWAAKFGFSLTSLIQGKIVACAEDDLGRHVYEIEAPGKALGAPARWFKDADVFMPTKKAAEFSADFR